MAMCADWGTMSRLIIASRVVKVQAGLLAALVAFAAMPEAQAQQRTWVGAGSDGNWSTQPNWSGAIANNNNGTLTFSGTSQTSTFNNLTGLNAPLVFSAGAGAFTINGNGFKTGALTNSSGVTQTINVPLEVLGTNHTMTLTGDIVINGVVSSTTSAAGININAGNGALYLNGDNVGYIGSVTLNVTRTLVLGHNNALGVGNFNWNNGVLNVTSGSSFSSSANPVINATSGTFGGSGNLTFTGTTSFNSTAARSWNIQSGTLALGTVGGANTTTTFSKSGAGTLVLGGPVSTIAATNVSAGTLFVNGNFSSLTTGTVAAAATLGGNGTLSGTMRMNGTLAPGSTGGNVGLLTLNDLILSSTSRTLIDINGSVRGTGFDAVTANAGLTYSGTLNFNMPTLLTGTFNVFDFASTTGSLATVSGLLGTQSVSFTNSGGVWTAPLTNGTATFTQSTGELVIVPEPVTIALAGLGLGCVGVAVWRRRAVRCQARR